MAKQYITPSFEVTGLTPNDLIVTSLAGINGNADIHPGAPSANKPRAHRNGIWD